MTWYVCSAATFFPMDEQVHKAARVLPQIVEQRDFAVFSDSVGGVHSWYFSPTAEFLAKALGATPCAKPAQAVGERYMLSIGHADSRDIHFPRS